MRFCFCGAAMCLALSAFASVVHADLLPAQAGWTEVYNLNIPQGAAFDGNSVPYSTNNAASIPNGSFTRVAYQLTLSGSTNPNSPNGFIWVAFDTYSNSAANLGVPNNVPFNAPIQQNVSNMTVISNVPGIVTGNNISTGNIEFWNSNYDQNNVAGVPNASNSTYDFGDKPDPGGYGSMQIANHGVGAEQMLLSYNSWGSNAGGSSDLGIGNNPAGDPDWTFRGNTGDYTFRDLEVFVLPLPEPSSILALAGLCGMGLIALVIGRRRFTAARIASIGAVVGVLFTTTAQAQVAQEAGFKEVYQLNVLATGGAPTFDATGVPYSLNTAGTVSNGSFARVAYELTLSGSTNPTSPNGTMWVSFNTPNANASLLGVPATATGEFYNQSVTNMTVISTLAGLTSLGRSDGTIQFWPTNYGTNGATGNFDWNDCCGGLGTGYGHMDVNEVTPGTGGASGVVLEAFSN